MLRNPCCARIGRVQLGELAQIILDEIDVM